MPSSPIPPAMVHPSDYYYGPFQNHFASFWKSLGANGSVSRVRCGKTLSRFAYQGERHFSVVDLVANPKRGFPDHLTEIPKDMQSHFLCALYYTILIDQVMYSHHRSDYFAFQALTEYPKMDRTVGYARTLMMANPSELFSQEILASRAIPEADLLDLFQGWAVFISSDLSDFFGRQQIGATTWSTVRESMLHDSSVTFNRFGSVLADALRHQPE